METNEPSRSLDDADDAPGSPPAATWWGRALTVVVIAGAIATIFGGPVNVATAVVVIAVLVAIVGGVFGWRRYRGGRPHRNSRRVSRTYRLVLIGMCAGGPLVAGALEMFLKPGTAASYSVQFLCAAIIYWVGISVLTQLDSYAFKSS
jgi:hypothetical protein